MSLWPEAALLYFGYTRFGSHGLVGASLPACFIRGYTLLKRWLGNVEYAAGVKSYYVLASFSVSSVTN